MSSYKVLNPFDDKDTGDRFGVGSTYYTENPERAQYLQSWGYLGEEVETNPEIQNKTSTQDEESEVDGLKSLGGGWYELPDGFKVQGKDEAIEALKELQGSDQ
jgi:hypothetical protein